MNSSDIVFVKSCNILNDLINIINKFPEKSDKVTWAVITMICVILIFTTICLNACTVITIWKTPVLREKLSNFTIMMQSSIDLLHGLLLMPIFTYLMLSEITGTGNCLVTYIYKKVASLIFLFSFTTFSALNHERYMGICHTMFHRTQVRKSHLLKYVVVVCLLQSLALGFSFYNYQHITRLVLGFSCFAFLAHTIFVYAKIARAIQIKVCVQENGQGSSKRRKLMQYLSEIKAAKTCFFIVTCCILCNLPVIITVTDMVGNKFTFKTLLLRKCFTILFMLNSSLNSVILFWRNKKLRIYAKTPINCK